MDRRSRIWLVLAVLFTLINAAGAVFAAARREVLHTSVHVALTALGVWLVWLLAPGHGVRRLWRRKPVMPGELSDRLTNLEQAVDAVAIEIERIGEGQRFIARSFTEHAPPRAAGGDAGAPVAREARDGGLPPRADSPDARGGR
ncbi:MAG TPA: hypothetical protein VFS44_15030 [Gemmatimonadaceae bacterium]|nr:hypothetical protein [Gemmatimonadaceae bacterium]